MFLYNHVGGMNFMIWTWPRAIVLVIFKVNRWIHLWYILWGAKQNPTKCCHRVINIRRTHLSIILARIPMNITFFKLLFKIRKLHLSQIVSKCYALIVYDQEVFPPTTINTLTLGQGGLMVSKLTLRSTYNLRLWFVYQLTTIFLHIYIELFF